jgi:hypothetical protein
LEDSNIVVIARSMISEFGDKAAVVLRNRADEHSRAGETEGADLWGLVAETVALDSDYPLDPTVHSVLASQTDEEKATRYRYRAGEMRTLATLPGAGKIRDALIVDAEHYETTAWRLEGLIRLRASRAGRNST